MDNTRPPELAEIEAPEHPDVTDDPSWLVALAHVSTWANRAAAAVAAMLLIAMTALILVEIAIRLFGKSTFMADALVGYGVAGLTFLAAAWALEDGAMIRVSVVTNLLPPRARFIAEAFTILSVGALLALLLIHQWSTVSRLYTRGSVSQHFFPIPLWIPEALFLSGLVLLTGQVIVRGLRLIAVGHSDERPLSL